MTEHDKLKSAHSPVFKKQLTDRLSRIEGQVRGLHRLIDEDTYCDDVINQIASTQAALNGVARALLDSHLRSCVKHRIEAGDEQVFDELSTTLSRLIKR